MSVSLSYNGVACCDIILCLLQGISWGDVVGCDLVGVRKECCLGGQDGYWWFGCVVVICVPWVIVGVFFWCGEYDRDAGEEAVGDALWEG